MPGNTAPTTAYTTSNQTVTSGATKTTTKYSTGKTQDTVVHKLTDNGSGGFGAFGTIDYASKTLSVRLVELDLKTEGYKSDHQDASAFEMNLADNVNSGSIGNKGGSYIENSVGEELLASSTVSVSYAKDFSIEVENQFSFSPDKVVIDLCPTTSDYVVPGSVMFTWMGHVYTDVDGVLWRDITTPGTGMVAGKINYSKGLAEITDYVVSGSVTSFVVNSLWTVRQRWRTASIFMRTQAAPLKPSGFVMNLSDVEGNSITAIADIDGHITGTHLRGKVQYITGIVELQFGDYVVETTLTDEQRAEWWYDSDDIGAVEPLKIWKPWPVDPPTLRYNSVAYFYLPIDAEILGLDPVRLPQDGRVPIFRQGSYVVVGHTGAVGPFVAADAAVIDCGRERLSRVRVMGNDGNVINTGYTADLDAGTVTFVDVTGYSQPVTLFHRIEDLVRVSDVQINGKLTFTRQLSHNFPLGTIVSSALVAGSLRARVSNLFDQVSWNGTTWSDIPGSPAPATYNDTAYPPEMVNLGALTERFALQFINGTTFNCIGEHVGNLGTGTINADFSPINPLTLQPYFVLREEGWGSGWAAGNTLFVHTVGAVYGFAAIRTVQQGSASGIDYSFELLGRGDVDRPPSAP